MSLFVGTLGTLYFIGVFKIERKRDLAWAEVQSYAEEYRRKHPEISDEALQIMAEDLYFTVLEQRGLK